MKINHLYVAKQILKLNDLGEPATIANILSISYGVTLKELCDQMTHMLAKCVISEKGAIEPVYELNAPHYW